MRPLLPILFAFFIPVCLPAQTPADLAIPLQTSAGINPPGVLLTWPNPQASDIQLRRRTKGQPGDAWITLLEESSSFRNGYYDTTSLAANGSYEYALSRQNGSLQAYGYAYAAIAAPVIDDRGKILIFVDSSSADQLGADLVNFKNDLRGEGWQIIPFHTGPYTTVQGLKSQIVSLYTADPSHIKAILLIGDVPVPYSGSLARDNRPDHVGAWPCDAYYGDVDGLWTDQTVNIPSTPRLANRNVPGDGKFDQNTLPSAVEIPVGRLDFRHLSAATFGLPPVELLRRYFLKNHRWRTGQINSPERALIDDQLGWSGGDAPAAEGFRNAYPLVGSDQVIESEFLAANHQHYLLGYGASISGAYSNAGSLGSAADYALDSINILVVNLSGNYFGDWDYESNPLLPALLASKGDVLACGWGGRPQWLLQGLAVGETIGFSLQETQNAQYNEAYGPSTGESGTHIALLGDPTLRVKIVKPATNLSAVSNCTHVNLHWTASPDPEVLGYLVYRAFNANGPYTRLTPSAVTATEWSDQNPVADTLYYSVRAMKWQVTPGGGNFYNSSTGVLKSVIFQPGNPPTVIGLGGELNCNTPALTLGSNSQPSSATVQWYKPNGTLLNGFTATAGGVYTVVATAPNGCTAVAYASVTVDTFLPAVDLPPNFTLNCSHPTAQYTIPAAPQGVYYAWNNVPVEPGEVIPVTGGAVLWVSSTVNGCSKFYQTQVITDFAGPGASALSDGHVLDCTHSSVQLYGIINQPDDQYVWTINGDTLHELNPLAVVPGNYCLIVTATNGCTAMNCIPISATGEAVTSQILPSGGPCSTASSVELGALVTGGTEPFLYQWSTGATTVGIFLPTGFTGNVGLTVTDSHGCTGMASYVVAPALGAITSFAFESSPGAADGNIDLLVIGGLAPYQYLWSNGQTTESITNLTSGVYTVTVTDARGCSFVYPISLITVGTTTPGLAQSVRIAPNPVSERVGIYFQQKEFVRLRLTDMSGRVVMTQAGEDSRFSMDVQALSTGLYVLWIETRSGRSSYKLVVSR